MNIQFVFRKVDQVLKRLCVEGCKRAMRSVVLGAIHAIASDRTLESKIQNRLYAIWKLERRDKTVVIIELKPVELRRRQRSG